MTIFHLMLGVFYSILLLTLTFIGIKKKILISFIPILCIGIFLRVLISLSFIPLFHYDVLSYKLIGSLTLAGKSMYPAYAYYHYPYLPGFNYIEALAIFVNQFGFPYMLFLKLFFSVFDVGNIILIYLLSRKNIQATFLYAVNPATIYLSAAHGQIEAIPIFFLLLAIYLYQKQKNFVTSIVLGLAILAKAWPLLFLPLFIRYTKKWYLYVISLAIPAISVLLYAKVFHASLLNILHPPLSYRGAYGAWGVSTLTHFILPQDVGVNNAIYKIIANITIVFVIVFAFLQKKTDLLKNSFTFMLLFSAVVISGANPLWLLPFIILIRFKSWTSWWILVNIYAIFSILHEITNPISIPLENIFITLSFLTAFFLWIVNLKMIFDYFHSTRKVQ